MTDLTPWAAAIRTAHRRIAPFVHRTPVLTSSRIDQLAGARLFFKCENFQRGGAFKARGAFNAVLSLDEEDAAAGVVTHSSGNHAAALAIAARTRGIVAHIVMPSTASEAKKAAVTAYGGQISYCEPTQAAREAMAAEIVRRTGAVMVHPYDDDAVIAGQATAAVELIDQAPGLEIVACPIGGGGLVSGAALATRWLLPDARVIAGEPAGADDAWRSLQAGTVTPAERIDTIADGLRALIAPRTFAVIAEHVSEIVTVPDEAIVGAMKLIWTAMKIVVEPSSAVPLAALLKVRPAIAGRRVGVILTGGNVDLDALPW